MLDVFMVVYKESSSACACVCVWNDPLGSLCGQAERRAASLPENRTAFQPLGTDGLLTQPLRQPLGFCFRSRFLNRLNLGFD